MKERQTATLPFDGRNVSFQKRGKSYSLVFHKQGEKPKRITLKWQMHELAREEAIILYSEWVRGTFDPWSDEREPAARGTRLRNAVAMYIEAKTDPNGDRPWSAASERNKSIILFNMASSVGDVALRSVTESQLKEFYNNPKYKPSTRSGYYCTIHAFFSWCLEKQLIQQSPLHKAKKPKIPRMKVPKALRDEEVERLLKFIPANRWIRDWIIFALETGMRLGEIKNQRWEDIDLREGRIYIRNRDSFRTKSGEDRWVPITPNVREVLEKIQDREGYVFGENTRRAESWIRKEIKRYGIQVGLGWISPHSFRHTYASKLARRNIAPGTIQRLLGHADSRMVERYSHFFANDLTEAVEKVFK